MSISQGFPCTGFQDRLQRRLHILLVLDARVEPEVLAAVVPG